MLKRSFFTNLKFLSVRLSPSAAVVNNYTWTGLYTTFKQIWEKGQYWIPVLKGSNRSKLSLIKGITKIFVWLVITHFLCQNHDGGPNPIRNYTCVALPYNKFNHIMSEKDSFWTSKGEKMVMERGGGNSWHRSSHI